MDSSINTTASQQGLLRSIDDSIDLQSRNVITEKRHFLVHFRVYVVHWFFFCPRSVEGELILRPSADLVQLQEPVFTSIQSSLAD